MDPQRQAPLGGQSLRTEAGLRQVAEPSCPARLLLRTPLALPDLTGYQQNPTQPPRSFPRCLQAGQSFPGVPSMESRDLLAGDREAIIIRRVLEHLVRASIISTGQALTQAMSQALEGETRGPAVLRSSGQRGGHPSGSKLGRTDRSQEAHSTSLSFLF